MNMPSLTQLTYLLTNFISHSLALALRLTTHSQTHTHAHTRTLRDPHRSSVLLWARCQCSQMALVEDEVLVSAGSEM